MRERRDELSSVPWSSLRRPGCLPASLAAAAAMAHSPVQAGLPGMQVSSCPKGRHGHAPRPGLAVNGGIPGAGGRKRLLALARPRGLGWGQRSGMETKRAVSAWRGARRGPSARGSLPASAPSIRPRQPLCRCRRAERSLWPPPPAGSSAALGVLILEGSRGSVCDFRPR